LISRIKKYSLLVGIALVILVLDQWTKSLVRNGLAYGEAWSPWEWLMPYARIVHWNNTGVAFGMFQGYGMVFTVLALIVATVIVYYYPRVPVEEWPLRIAMGMQLGGALGNLIDRVTNNGQVTDFISVGNFAVFNIADASISVGVAVLLIGMWWKDRSEAKKAETTPNPDTKIEESGQSE
jgi:signal peptidase II